jgi:signal transduction histidine kinase
MAQALELLLDNAFRHGAPPVEVVVRCVESRVAVCVRDRGRGVPEADAERVYERFVRLDASRGTPGVGLGLSIARGLVGTMGGTVRTGSVEGGGAAFTVELVTASAVAAAVPEPGTAPLRLVAG